MAKSKKSDLVRNKDLEKLIKDDIQKNGATLRVLISIKLDPNLLKRIKQKAEFFGIGYQTLIHEKLIEAFPEKEEISQSKKIVKQIKILVDDLSVAIGK